MTEPDPATAPEGGHEEAEIPEAQRGSELEEVIEEVIEEAAAVIRRSLASTIVRRTVAALTLVLLLSVAALSQTRRGQELVLDAALDRIRGALAGELTVGGIRSGTLLTGATLTEVRLEAAGGREFMQADSVVVRYSLVSLVAGATPIRSTTFWGVDVEISQYSADDVLNVTRLLAEGEPDTTATPRRPGAPTDLGRIGVRDGVVRLLTPASPGTTAETVTGPDGALLRQLRFEDLDLDLENTMVRPGGAVEFEAGLASFSASVYLQDEPLVLREVFGDVTFGAQGIRVQNGAFRLPSTLVRGDFTMGPVRSDGPWIARATLEPDGWGDLADLAWIDPRIPEGRFRGRAVISVPGPVEVDLDRFEVELEASNLVADGWVRFDERTSLRSMEVTVSPLAVSRLEPWLQTSFPLDGWLSGQATFSGSLYDLNTTGRITLVPTGYGGAATTADFNGTIHRGANPGATDFEALFRPLNYTVLESLWPTAPVAAGGFGHIQVNGRADDGLAVVADFTHEPDSASMSRAALQGLVRRLDDGGWISDVSGDVIPLSVGTFASLVPDLGLRGSLAGPVRFQGRLDDLRVSADLVTEGGGVVVNGSLDLTDPGSWYRLEAEADALPLAELTDLPDRTSWTGRLSLDGAGLGIDSLESTISLVASDSRVGAVRVDTVSATFRIRDGVLITDTLEANVGGIDVDGRGRFGLVEGSWGASRFAFEGQTLVGLRPLLMGVGDSVLVRDNLNPLMRDFLRAEGIDPDTLPSELDVRMGGDLAGQMSVSGELRSFDVGLLVDLVGAQYRHNEVDTAQIALTGTGLPGTDGRWEAGVSARGVVWQDRVFEQGGFEAEMADQAGVGRIELRRDADEAYSASGSFEFGESNGEVGLTDARFQVGESVWNLTKESRLAWDETSLVVDSLEITRTGADPMSLSANGVLTRGGDSDFHLAVDGLHVERVIHIAQIDELDIDGHVDLDLTVSGPSESPRIDGLFRIDGPRYRSMQLTRVDGSLDYADQSVVFGLTGWDLGRDAIDASGTLPLDLSLAVVEDRVLSRPMDVQITADSLDAAIALSYLTTLDDVRGVVTGDVHIGGTPDEPEPEGLITLSEAAWSVEAIGVRHSEVDGSLTLNPDRTVDVSITSTGPGYSEVAGTVTLDPFRNPPLDLTFTFDRFQAVERLDVEGLISGQFALGGTYRRPVAEGSLTVDQGTIYVDEFQRVAGVVDLSDPFLFERGLGVDTTALVAQPLVAGLRTPFFDSLRVNIDLAVPRDTWLRSIETNVEMSGDLLVAYDRSAADLVLIGELEAVRGSHLVLGRTFDLDGGAVSFIGRPGLNPDLDIAASTRVRRRDDDLEVLANVGGTLVQPIVTLSTDEVGVGEADLVSYLIFGQATAELGSSQNEVFGQFSNNAAISTLSSGGLTWYGGALANQFGTAIARGIGLDYLSVQLDGASSGAANPLGSRAQLEAGRYVGHDVFVVLVFRPGANDAESSNFLGGARVEWALTDDYNLEGFLEDRFLRSGTAGFALPGLLQDNRVVGLFVFRDWGY